MRNRHYAGGQEVTGALPPAREHEDGQASALTRLGDVRLQTSDYPAATQAHEQALGIYRDLGDRYGQASTLRYLGS